MYTQNFNWLSHRVKTWKYPSKLCLLRKLYSSYYHLRSKNHDYYRFWAQAVIFNKFYRIFLDKSLKIVCSFTFFELIILPGNWIKFVRRFTDGEGLELSNIQMGIFLQFSERLWTLFLFVLFSFLSLLYECLMDCDERFLSNKKTFRKIVLETVFYCQLLNRAFKMFLVFM